MELTDKPASLRESAAVVKVIADSSVWIAHLRTGTPGLADLLGERKVLTHSVVIGELACGTLKNRHRFLGNLKILPAALEATSAEVMDLIEAHALWGKGIGYSDVQILASALISNAKLLTLDRRLFSAAARLGCAFQ